MTATREPSRTTRRVLALGLGSVLLFGLAACGSDSDDSSGGSSDAAAQGDVVLTADNIAWSTDELEAPADTDFTIVVDNQDAGVQHNLDIKDTDFKTDLEAGVTQQTLQINLPAGEYSYVCDLHPNMTGTLTVS